MSLQRAMELIDDQKMSLSNGAYLELCDIFKTMHGQNIGVTRSVGESDREENYYLILLQQFNNSRQFDGSRRLMFDAFIGPLQISIHMFLYVEGQFCFRVYYREKCLYLCQKSWTEETLGNVMRECSNITKKLRFDKLIGSFVLPEDPVNWFLAGRILFSTQRPCRNCGDMFINEPGSVYCTFCRIVLHLSIDGDGSIDDDDDDEE